MAQRTILEAMMEGSAHRAWAIVAVILTAAQLAALMGIFLVGEVDWVLPAKVASADMAGLMALISFLGTVNYTLARITDGYGMKLQQDRIETLTQDYETSLQVMLDTTVEALEPHGLTPVRSRAYRVSVEIIPGKEPSIIAESGEK